MGWVKLHRRSFKSSVWENPIYWMVWCWCLMRANHVATKVPFNGKDVVLLPGEFITGRNKALKEVPVSARQWRTATNYLKSTNRLTIKTTNKFSVFGVVNWGQYQDTLKKTTIKTTKYSTSHRPTNDQPPTTDKNEKNDKKYNFQRIDPEKYKPDFLKKPQ